ncbi:TPR repeat containing protein [Gracilaria domingensis]|nr:TPR repeat containing protein [Gracilaria domingensis]
MASGRCAQAAFCVPVALPKRRTRRALTPVTQVAYVPRCSLRLGRSVAAAALVLALNTSPLMAQVRAQEMVAEPQQERTERDLREMSRRNTRLTGKKSQLFSSARRAAAEGDLDGALGMYNRLVGEAPTFAPAYSNRANILVAGGKFTEAERDYGEALKLAPLDGDTWVLYVNRGATRLALGRTEDALADLNDAYRLRGDDQTILSNRASVYEVLGKWDNAIRDYQKALKSNDVQPFWIRYALVLFQRNKSFEALAILKRVVAKFPDVSDVHAALALIYYDRGDIAAAETEWSAVDRPRLFESQSFLAEERKWPPRAIKTLDNFRHLNPQ